MPGSLFPLPIVQYYFNSNRLWNCKIFIFLAKPHPRLVMSSSKALNLSGSFISCAAVDKNDHYMLVIGKHAGYIIIIGNNADTLD